MRQGGWLGSMLWGNGHRESEFRGLEGFPWTGFGIWLHGNRQCTYSGWRSRNAPARNCRCHGTAVIRLLGKPPFRDRHVSNSFRTIRPMRNERPTIGIDLFCGAGGMTLGARQAGIDVVYAVEMCPITASTYRMNFPEIPMFIGDLRELKSIPDRPKEAQTIVFGGPPCQGFSTSNQRTRNTSNPDNWMYQDLIRVAKKWKPDWIIIENVKGIRETLKGFFLIQVIESLETAGYTTSTTTLNAVHYGVPQRRERTFIVASRKGKVFTDPARSSETPVTVEGAIDDLPVLEAGASIDRLPYRCRAASTFARSLRRSLDTVTGNLVTRNAAHVLERYPYIPQGGNWEDIPSSLLQNYSDVSRCHTGIYRRLDALEPSVVIGNFRKNMLIHPHQHRGLSVREAARIQSVPDSFRFMGSIGFQQQQVGNMVPPALAKAVMSKVTQA